MPRKPACIIDLDDSLCDTSRRRAVTTKFPAVWGPNEYKRYYVGLENDVLNKWCAWIVLSAYRDGMWVCFVTGRPQNYFEETFHWLGKHGLLEPHKTWTLFMRGDVNLDMRPDTVVKKQIYEQNIRWNFDVAFVIEDRSSVVKMWREECGLTVLQCAQNDF